MNPVLAVNWVPPLVLKNAPLVVPTNTSPGAAMIERIRLPAGKFFSWENEVPPSVLTHSVLLAATYSGCGPAPDPDCTATASISWLAKLPIAWKVAALSVLSHKPACVLPAYKCGGETELSRSRPLGLIEPALAVDHPDAANVFPSSALTNISPLARGRDWMGFTLGKVDGLKV